MHPFIRTYGAFKNIDGKIILISVWNELELKRFCLDLFEDFDYIAKFPDDTSRTRSRIEIFYLVKKFAGRMSHAEATSRMEKKLKFLLKH